MPDHDDPADQIFGDAHDQKVRERAYHLWEQDGSPNGGDLDYWERARALVGMESGAAPGLTPNPVPPGEEKPFAAPPVDEAFLEENLGEVPGRMTDQGERAQTPIVRKKKSPTK